MDKHDSVFVQPEDDYTNDMEAPPRYDEHHEAAGRLLSGTAEPTGDGRIEVNLDSKVAQALVKLIDVPPEDETYDQPPDYTEQKPWILPMNIVIQVVGSRGDVQPFVALGNELQRSGHRVRIATHSVFKAFVQSAGLEFYSIGGDPSELMAYMVKNPGLIPNMKTLRSGEIKRKREMIAEMLRGCWKSCIESDADTNAPFVANAVIANPVSFAHIHCAQALSIPLHLVFTMPWSPTRAFPHPLANLTNTSTDPKLANYLSYGMVNALTWQGLGDVINDFRKTLDLEVLPTTEAPFLAETLRIPYTYCWSPALVPKPSDWRDHIDVSGFIFRQSPTYEAPPELAHFLKAGPPPVYIGFGSIVVDNPEALLATVLEAIKRSGVRAIVSKGWSDFSTQETPDNVLFLGDCPHEWLFQHVSAVVHHGGAGTCAAGLLNGRPTVIIPFFGDQPFWGDRVAAAGAGPPPIPHKQLTATNLAEAITFCLIPAAAEAAAGIAERMKLENGVEAAAASFYRQLSAEVLRCDLIPTLPAVYEVTVKSKKFKISASAAETLIKHERIKTKSLRLYEPKPIAIENRRWDPLTSAGSAGVGVGVDMLSAVNDIWYAPYKMQKEAEREAKKSKGKQRSEDKIKGSSPALSRTGSERNISQNTDSKTNGTRPTTDADPEEGPSNGVTPAVAAKMVGVSALSIPKLYNAMLKGMLVDTPYAITEGFRNAPRLYGEHVPEHEPVTDYKSGLIVGGKEFARGMGDGLVDLFKQPYQGAKEDGPKGFVTGLGKGAMGTVTKLGAGSMALWGYPAQGIYRSVRDLTNQGTKKVVMRARRVHDLHWAKRDMVEEGRVLKAWDEIVATVQSADKSSDLVSHGSDERRPFGQSD